MRMEDTDFRPPPTWTQPLSPLRHPDITTPLPPSFRTRRPGRVSLGSLYDNRKVARAPIYRSLSTTDRPLSVGRVDLGGKGGEGEVGVCVEGDVFSEEVEEGGGCLWSACLREVVRAMAWDPNTQVLWLRMDDSRGREPLWRYVTHILLHLYY